MLALLIRSETTGSAWRIWPEPEAVMPGAIHETASYLFELRDASDAGAAELLIDDRPLEALREGIANFAASGTHSAGDRRGHAVGVGASDVDISRFTAPLVRGRRNVEMNGPHSYTQLEPALFRTTSRKVGYISHKVDVLETRIVGFFKLRIGLEINRRDELPRPIKLPKHRTGLIGVQRPVLLSHSPLSWRTTRTLACWTGLPNK
jgi:hypothetical protein